MLILGESSKIGNGSVGGSPLDRIVISTSSGTSGLNGESLHFTRGHAGREVVLDNIIGIRNLAGDSIAASVLRNKRQRLAIGGKLRSLVADRPLIRCGVGVNTAGVGSGYGYGLSLTNTICSCVVIKCEADTGVKVILSNSESNAQSFVAGLDVPISAIFRNLRTRIAGNRSELHIFGGKSRVIAEFSNCNRQVAAITDSRGSALIGHGSTLERIFKCFFSRLYSDGSRRLTRSNFSRTIFNSSGTGISLSARGGQIGDSEFIRFAVSNTITRPRVSDIRIANRRCRGCANSLTSSFLRYSEVR